MYVYVQSSVYQASNDADADKVKTDCQKLYLWFKSHYYAMKYAHKITYLPHKYHKLTVLAHGLWIREV